jgi:hypothetical protein
MPCPIPLVRNVRCHSFMQSVSYRSFPPPPSNSSFWLLRFKDLKSIRGGLFSEYIVVACLLAFVDNKASRRKATWRPRATGLRPQLHQRGRNSRVEHSAIRDTANDAPAQKRVNWNFCCSSSPSCAKESCLACQCMMHLQRWGMPVYTLCSDHHSY